MQFDDDTYVRLGMNKRGGLTNAGSVMNYTAGVVMRERERLARIFESNGMPIVATQIRDDSQDLQVFEWKGERWFRCNA